MLASGVAYETGSVRETELGLRPRNGNEGVEQHIDRIGNGGGGGQGDRRARNIPVPGRIQRASNRRTDAMASRSSSAEVIVRDGGNGVAPLRRGLARSQLRWAVRETSEQWTRGSLRFERASGGESRE